MFLSVEVISFLNFGNFYLVSFFYFVYFVVLVRDSFNYIVMFRLDDIII